VVDEEFHRALFGHTVFEGKFEDLKALQKFLCKDHKLRLSRREVCIINQLVKERYFSFPDIYEIVEVEHDVRVFAIRGIWCHSMSFPGDIELCALIGLACLDTNFRESLFKESSSDPKKLETLKKLVEDPARSPAFRVGLGELTLVNELIRAEGMVDNLANLRQEFWVPPDNTCETGYTQHFPEQQKPYIYVSETRLLVRQDLLRTLQDAGVAR
jgi:hypothetical protein